jgi:hypothetical protein
MSSNASENDRLSLHLTIPRDILRRILDSSSRGQKLTQEEQEQLALLLNADDFFVSSDHPLPDEKAAENQIKVLGRHLRKALVNASEGGRLTEFEQSELRDWLYVAGRRLRRFNRRQITYVSVYFLVMLGFAIVVLLFFKLDITNRLVLLPLIVAIGVLAGAAFKDALLDKNVETALSEMKGVVEKSRHEVRVILEKNLRPRIVSLNSRNDVLQAANEMLLETIQETKGRRFVYFIGAAALSTSRAGAGEDDKLSLVEHYNNRLRNLEGAKVPVTRYVALIKPEDFTSGRRRDETKKDYVPWLEKQIVLLKGNPKYELIDCQRAQSWGGSRSSIITHNAFLDIVGDGEAGFIVKDEEVARTLRRSSEKLFASAIQHSYSGDDEQSIERLESIYEQLKG